MARKFIMTSNVSQIYIPTADYTLLKTTLQTKLNMQFGTGGVFECMEDQYNKLPNIILTFKNSTDE